MTRRLVKRHKRQVARAKSNVKLSEPDVRTPEEVRAAREASRPAGARRKEPVPLYAARSGPAAATPKEEELP